MGVSKVLGLRKVSGWYPEVVWRVFGGCLEGVWEVSGRWLEGVCKVSEGL